MIFLTATNETLRLTLTQGVSTDITTGWIDHSNDGATPGSFQINTSTAGATTIVVAPLADVQRQVKFVSVKNKHASTTEIVTIQKFNGSNAFDLVTSIPLAPNEALIYVDSVGFQVLDTTGARKISGTGGGGGSGTVTFVDAVQPAEGLTVTGGPITSNGSFVLALANDLAAVEGLSANGLAVRAGTDSWTLRTLLAGSSKIVVTNGSGVAGAPTIDVDQTQFTLTQSQITGLVAALAGKQPLDTTLTSLAAFNTSGLLTQTATDTFTGRTIVPASSRVSVTDGNGVAGNPTIDAVFGVIQAVSGTIAQTSTNNVIPFDATTPTIIEGVQVFSQSFTPLRSDTTILIMANMFYTVNSAANRFVTGALFQGTTCLRAAMIGYTTDTGEGTSAAMFTSAPATDTSARTYSMRVGTDNASGALFINQGIGGQTYGGAAGNGRYLILEILP